jgi:serine/threonine-protein kinase
MTLESSTDPTELAARNVGRVLVDKWRLERVIGSGGMATVYAASHRNNLRTVAIKILHPQLASDTELRRRFLREGYIANKVGHTGAVTVLDDGIAEDGSVFLIMDLLIGESLHERQRRAVGVLEAHEVLRIVDKILDVLAAAHEQGIVHRDLKPDNIFLTRDGDVKVLDFGIARLVEPFGDDRATRTGVMIGTPSYMPPEQARGRSNLVDARSDLWAVGAMMYGLLTGHHVHEAETQNEVLLRAMTTPAPPLSTHAPDIHASIQKVVDRALAFEPDDRWQDARTMQAAVREALADVEKDGPPVSLRGTMPGPTGEGRGPATGKSLLSSVKSTNTPIIGNRPRARQGRRMFVLLVALGGLTVGGALFVRWMNGTVRPATDPSASIEAGVVDGGGPLESTISAMSSALGAAMNDLLDASTAADAEDPDADLDDGGYEDDDGGEEDEEEVDAGALVTPGHTVKPSKPGVKPKPTPHPRPKKRPRKRR